MRFSEPDNPFYLLLLLASLLFVATALGYALVPTLEEKAVEAGQVPPQSAFRDALRTDGWQWLLYEVGAMILFGVLSMGLDRLRSLKKERARSIEDQPYPSAESPAKIAAKEAAMIELTEQQRQALNGTEQPPVVVDPQTGQEYLLIRREIYEQVRGILKPFNRGWEDEPDTDAYEQYRKKP
jgi:hypothetical protein